MRRKVMRAAYSGAATLYTPVAIRRMHWSARPMTDNRLPRPPRQSALLFTSAALMALMGVQVKALTALLPAGERLPDLEVTFARFAFGLAVMLVLAPAGRVRLQSERPG